MKRQNPGTAKQKKGPKNGASRKASLVDLLRTERFRFAFVFGFSCLGLWALVCVLRPVCAGNLQHTARVLGHVLDAFGFPVHVAGNIVAGGGVSFRIGLECTALSAMALFTCFVSSYKTQAHKKVLGLVMGIPALHLGNVVRLVSIFVVSQHDPRLFEVVHVYMGQVFTIIVIVLSCVVWLRWADRDSPAGPVGKIAGFPARLVLISGCLFLIWMEIHHWYIRLLDLLMIFGFSLFDYRLFVPRENAVYYETFSIVAFVSLVLATKSISRPRKAKGLAAGLGLLVLLHLFHRVNNALMSAFHFMSLVPLDVFLCDIGQYLLPVVLWLTMHYVDRPEKKELEGPSRRSMLLGEMKKRNARL